MDASIHWADLYAQKIVRERGDKTKRFVCASGITPSGTVHIGNFREIISVELVVQALKDLGKKVRYIFSWDDFDVFRKVPMNIPERERFEQYLRMPITSIPDPWKRAENYARGNEVVIEELLRVFGIVPEYIYQSKEYQKNRYSEGIRRALECRSELQEILNEFRETALPSDWFPVSVFSSFTQKDTTKVLSWDGEWNLTYRCLESKKEETLDIRKSSLIKLLWRVDWPMRWKEEQVDFEPAGKDHHSHGGSFDTAKKIVQKVYDYQSPVTFQYDFVRVKGGSGKISSSSGEVIGIDQALEIYVPQIVRYLFAGSKPNSEFCISFDLEVIKIYEEYDRLERMYFEKSEEDSPKRKRQKRIYELSQVGELPKQQPLQVPFRHLCNLLQIYQGDQDATLEQVFLQEGIAAAERGLHEEAVRKRMTCVWSWLAKYAPEDFTFQLRALDSELAHAEEGAVQKAVSDLRKVLMEHWDDLSDKKVNEHIYDVARTCDVEPSIFFRALYQRLLGKDKGPRLGSFLRILGKERIGGYLQ